MAFDDMKASRTARIGVGEMNRVELKCFRILAFYCCAIRNRKDKYWILYVLSVIKICG